MNENYLVYAIVGRVSLAIAVPGQVEVVVFTDIDEPRVVICGRVRTCTAHV